MINIYAPARGGFIVQGRGFYEPRDSVVIVQAVAGETVNVAARFASAINTVDVEASSIEASDPVISGVGMTMELSNFSEGGKARYDVRLSTGEVHFLNLQIGGIGRGPLGSDIRGDYGSFEP